MTTHLRKTFVRLCAASTLALFLAYPFFAFAATEPAGFAREGVWFSRDPFFAGETITIYTMLYNSGPDRLTGVVDFRDGTKTLGTKPVSVAPNGSSEIVSLPWEVTAGTHQIEARFREAYVTNESGLLATATPKYASSGSVARTAELDSDGDRIGNPSDPDDDNDGLSDAAEAAKKTDPKNPDTDGDGLTDAADPQPLVPAAKSATSTRGATKVEEGVKELATDAAGLIPDDMKEKSVPVLGAIGDIREDELARTAERVQAARTKLLISPAASGTMAFATATDWEVVRGSLKDTTALRSPFAYVWFVFLLCYQWVIAHPIVLGIIAFFFVVQLIRAIIRLFV